MKATWQVAVVNGWGIRAKTVMESGKFGGEIFPEKFGEEEIHE